MLEVECAAVAVAVGAFAAIAVAAAAAADLANKYREWMLCVLVYVSLRLLSFAVKYARPSSPQGSFDSIFVTRSVDFMLLGFTVMK